MAFFGKYYDAKTAILVNSTDHDELLGRGEARKDAWRPAVDIFETTEGVVVIADLPGVRVEDLAVHIEGTLLTIRGTRVEESPHQKKCYHQMEIMHGAFERTLSLPCLVKQGEAHLHEGILELFLPKALKRPRGTVMMTVC